ncbi:MAG: hypothetical protein ACI376_02520 [Candidatus Bruticola sp.]
MKQCVWLLSSIALCLMFSSAADCRTADPAAVGYFDISTSSLISQADSDAYNSTFSKKQAALLKMLPCAIFYYPQDNQLVLSSVQINSYGQAYTYKLTYTLLPGDGELIVEGANGGIGDIQLKSGYDSYTVKNALYGSGTAYLKRSSSKNKADFYSDWIEWEPCSYCRFTGVNLPYKYVKGAAASLKQLK